MRRKSSQYVERFAWIIPGLLGIVFLLLLLGIFWYAGYRPTSGTCYLMAPWIFMGYGIASLIALVAAIFFILRRRWLHAIVTAGVMLLMILTVLGPLPGWMRQSGRQQLILETDLPALVRETTALWETPPAGIFEFGFHPQSPHLKRLAGSGRIVFTVGEDQREELEVIFDHEPVFTVRHDAESRQWLLEEDHVTLLSTTDTSLPPPAPFTRPR